MSDSDNAPLLPSTSKRLGGAKYRPHTDYLLLPVPVDEDKNFIQKLNNIGNYSGIIVAVSAVVIIIFLIVGITFRDDITQFGNGGNSTDIQSTLLTLSNSNTLRESSEILNKEITTPLGRLKGYVKKSRKGRDFLAFYKVPYAQPPIGELRFRDPQPAESWKGIRDFSAPTPQCIQKARYPSIDEAVGEEDCLYSNIYVPLTGDGDVSKNSFPTMVYIHGGGFGDGNGTRYGADYFMDEDVILLTFEFRLGLFGFLNTGDREATGNMGLKDQVMMLKWTKNYIRYFGGDPDCVTIFGNSGGGYSVGFLMISPMANALFHRAISQSGTSLTETYNTIDLQPELTKKAAANAFNCSLETSKELLECLRKVDSKKVAVLRTPETTFGLTVEQGFDRNDLSDVFMPEKPYDLLKAGKVSRVPYIIGIGATEWISAALAILKNKELTNAINSNFSQFAPSILEMDLSPQEANQIKAFFFGNKEISISTERNLTNLLSDRVMVHGSKTSAYLHSQFSETYLYYLSKRPKKSYADKILVNFPGFDASDTVSHADELQFLFPYSGYPEYPPEDTEFFPFSEFMVKLWVRFAATGKPALNAETEKWIPINSEEPKKNYWFELNDQVGLTPVLNERMLFWDNHFTHKKLKYEL